VPARRIPAGPLKSAHLLHQHAQNRQRKDDDVTRSDVQLLPSLCRLGRAPLGSTWRPEGLFRAVKVDPDEKTAIGKDDLDPDDVAAGHVVRFKRSAQSKIVRSREPAHPAIISVEDFTRVQLELRDRAGASRAGRTSLNRTRVSAAPTYLFRGAIRHVDWSQDGRCQAVSCGVLPLRRTDARARCS
jgi:hypothetical protein